MKRIAASFDASQEFVQRNGDWLLAEVRFRGEEQVRLFFVCPGGDLSYSSRRVRPHEMLSVPGGSVALAGLFYCECGCRWVGRLVDGELVSAEATP